MNIMQSRLIRSPHRSARATLSPPRRCRGDHTEITTCRSAPHRFAASRYVEMREAWSWSCQNAEARRTPDDLLLQPRCPRERWHDDPETAAPVVFDTPP